METSNIARDTRFSHDDPTRFFSDKREFWRGRRGFLDLSDCPIPLFTAGERASKKLVELTLNLARKLIGEPKLIKGAASTP